MPNRIISGLKYLYHFVSNLLVKILPFIYNPPVPSLRLTLPSSTVEPILQTIAETVKVLATWQAGPLNTFPPPSQSTTSISVAFYTPVCGFTKYFKKIYDAIDYTQVLSKVGKRIPLVFIGLDHETRLYLSEMRIELIAVYITLFAFILRSLWKKRYQQGEQTLFPNNNYPPGPLIGSEELYPVPFYSRQGAIRYEVPVPQPLPLLPYTQSDRPVPPPPPPPPPPKATPENMAIFDRKPVNKDIQDIVDNYQVPRDNKRINGETFSYLDPPMFRSETETVNEPSVHYYSSFNDSPGPSMSARQREKRQLNTQCYLNYPKKEEEEVKEEIKEEVRKAAKEEVKEAVKEEEQEKNKFDEPSAEPSNSKPKAQPHKTKKVGRRNKKSKKW